jgi:hypothetical protein
MPVTSPCTSASPSPPSPARSSTSRRRCGQTASSERWRRPRRLALYDHGAITDVLERANGHRGKAALTRATAGEPKLTRSELEARFLALVRRAGLPEPDANISLDALDHQPHEVDFSFPTHNLVVELDGWETHGTKAAFKSDRRKDAALTATGYRGMRFTYDDIVHDPETVVARLSLTRRSAAA